MLLPTEILQKFGLIIAIAALWMLQPTLANPIIPVTLEFEEEGLDLDTGTVVSVEPWTFALDLAAPQPDLVLAYNSERAICAVVFHNQMNGVEIAFLDGVSFNLVDSADLVGLVFTAEVVDEPFETGDSVVLRTDTGAHYLLGNPVEDAAGVTFDTQLLEERAAGLVRPAAFEPETILARASVPPDEAPQSSSPALPPGLSIEDWRQVRGLIEEDGYRFRLVSEQPEIFVTRNADHGLRAELDGSGLRLSSSTDDDWDWSLALVAYGYAGALRPAEVGQVVAQGNRLEHRRGDLVEWYVNDGQGLEQGFTLAARPDGKRAEPLALRLASSGSLAPAVEDGSGVRLVDGVGRTVLRYAGLLAWDATGRELPARLAAETGGLTIEVDDAGAVYPVTIDPTVVHEDAKLTASDAAADDRFGVSVALSGDTAVVGADRDDHAGGTDSGSAYVFVRNGTSWSEQAKLTASDAAAGDRFGGRVALSGDTAVVGAQLDTHGGGTNAGSAYVFVRNGTSWSEQAKLTASDAAPTDLFGISVALSGDTAVVGAVLARLAAAGSAYVFVRSGTSWSEQAKLTASDAAPADFFGLSVAVSGDTAVVGAFQDEHAGGMAAGSAYVFLRSGTSWSEQAKLTASDAAPIDLFGFPVALSGDTAAVGAFSDDHAGGTDAGSAYVFLRSGTSWSEQAKLTASDAVAGDEFGGTIALSGDTAVVGVALNDHAGGTDAGSAYVFLRSGTSWSEQAKLAASDAAAVDFFGLFVALSADTAVVAARDDDHAGGTNAGSAYVFELSSNQPPVALCVDATVAAGFDCTADALIDADSFDPDNDPITLSQDPPGPYGPGTTLVTLTVTDDKGASNSCTATVTVEDTTPPALAVTLDPDTLWPPNHHMIDVDATVIASDNCDAPVVALASLTSNEADDAQGIGDGKTTADILPGADDFHFRLRAERAGTGSGRIYTAVYTATDGAGNAASEAGFAVVPHDQGGVIDPVAIVLEESSSGTMVSWTVVPGAASYDVIRGDLDKLAETDVAINLGAVLCIEENSTDISTLGHEDAVLPAPGKAFFYLVEYYDGISSTFGSESAGKPRAPGAGACQ